MSITYRAPGASFETEALQGGPGTYFLTGGVGTYRIRIDDGQGATVTAATTAGIVEEASGIYVATLAAPSVGGTYALIWDDGAGHEADGGTLEVTFSAAVGGGGGAILHLETTFAVDGILTDPSSVVLTVRAPDGTSEAYSYGSGGTIVRDSTGTYHADVPAPIAGGWAWEWESTGAAAGEDHGMHWIERSTITHPWLCTLADITLARQDATGGARDELIEALITRASEALETAAGRQFTLDQTSTSRYFPIVYSDDRVVRIDDLSDTPTEVEVTDAEGEVIYTATVATDVVLRPRNRRTGEPITSLRLRSSVPMSDSYELRVLGVWGWPVVPGDIREACIEMVIGWMKNHQGLTLQSPDQFDPGGFPQRAMPMKSLDLIRRYRRLPIA